MAIYKTRWFDRWSRRQGIGDATLRRAAREMADGLHDADLGGGLFKKRVARLGQGKRGGFRTLVATNQKNRWVFVYGFAKNVAHQHRCDRSRSAEEIGGAPVVFDSARP